MNPLTNVFRWKDMVKGVFLLREFNILLEEKPCPWSPRWQIMELILLASQICIPHKCTALLLFSRITLESRSDAVTSNFSTDINHLWIRPSEDKGRSIWIYLFASLPPPIDSVWRKEDLGHGARNSVPYAEGVEQARSWVRQVWSSWSTVEFTKFSLTHSSMTPSDQVTKEALIKLVQDSLISHLHVHLLNVIATKYCWSPALI